MARNVTGQALDYESFKREYDTNPALADIVDNFDERSITLKTTDTVEPPQSSPAQSQLDGMAKRAADKVVNR